MTKHRGFDSVPGDESQRGEERAMAKASLEANAESTKGALPTNLPDCPTDGKFLTLVPYIYDYCEKVAKFRPACQANEPIRVPLPGGKRFEIEPKRLVNQGYSMVDKIQLGKSGMLECKYSEVDGKKTISFDKSTIKVHSTVAPYLGSHGRPFYFEQSANPKKTFMIFENASPKWIRDKIHADARDIIRKDINEEAQTPQNITADSEESKDQLAKRKKK